MSLENRKAVAAGTAMPYPAVGIIDLGINADPQEEEAAVYQNLTWIRSITPPEQPLHVRTVGKLGDDLITGRNSTGQRFASLPLFTSNHEDATATVALIKNPETSSAVAIATLKEFALTVSPPGIDDDDSEVTADLFDPDVAQFHDQLAGALTMAYLAGELMRVEKMIIQNTQFGRVKRQCTSEYKIEPIERFIRYELLGLTPGDRVPKTVMLEQVIGISFDEAGRAVRIRERFKVKPWSKCLFPLIEMKMTRTDCQDYLRAFGMPHPAPRSACTFCPFHSEEEWKRLKELPAEWARIVEIDYALRKLGNIVNRGAKQKMYLHRSCRPIDTVDFDALILAKRAGHVQSSFFIECEGMCGN